MAGRGGGGGREAWGRTCGTCRSAAAMVYCRSDAAFFCGACDARVHSSSVRAAAAVVPHHERVLVCEVCESSPAVVTCKADAAALCVTCDSDIHSANPLARRHERIPILPVDLMSPAAAAAGVLNPSAAAAEMFKPSGFNSEESNINHDCELNVVVENEFNNNGLYDQDVEPYLDLEFASSMEEAGFDGVVPTGRDGGVAGAAMALGLDVEEEMGFVTKQEQQVSYSNYSISNNSVSSSEAAVVPDGGSIGLADVSNPYAITCLNPSSLAAVTPLIGADREARVMRYREKRKNRKFQKTIRYASRKAYAETRPRIKGRFAKRSNTIAVDSEYLMHHSDAIPAAALMAADVGYGIVPSF